MQTIKKLFDTGSFECFMYDDRKAFFPCRGKFVFADVLADKKADVVIDRIKLSNHPDKVAFTTDKRNALFVNTSGEGFVYDMTENMQVCKVKTGLELFTGHLAGCDNGFLFIDWENYNDSLYYMDALNGEKTHIDCIDKCRYLFDAGENILLFVIDRSKNDGGWIKDCARVYSVSKSNPTDIKALDWILPEGDVKNVVRTYDGEVLIIIQQVRGHYKEVVYRADIVNHKVQELFEADDFIESDDGYLKAVDANIKDGKLYFMTAGNLKIIDIDTKQVLFKQSFKYGADVKRIKDNLIVSTWEGVFRLDV